MCIHTHLTRAKNKPLLVAVGVEGAKLGVTGGEGRKEKFDVQKRGGEILQVRGGSSVFSAANAVVDHLRDLYVGSERIVSLGVHS